MKLLFLQAATIEAAPAGFGPGIWFPGVWMEEVISPWGDGWCFNTWGWYQVLPACRGAWGLGAVLAPHFSARWELSLQNAAVFKKKIIYMCVYIYVCACVYYIYKNI